MDRQNSDDIAKFLEGMASFDDVLFGFLEDGNQSPGDFSGDGKYDDQEGDDGEENANCSAEENKAFWEEQEQLIQANLCRTSSVERKIRQATKEALKEANLVGVRCLCQNPAAGNCRSCRQQEICRRLRNAGYDCTICKSKWRSSKEMPSGEHTYLEVLDNSNPKRGEMRIVIEIAFRAEFEMARSSEEYKRLIRRLPEVYVGKSDRLRSLVKILCSAAKKCMKDKKMHMGPWRKHKYMQAKWLGTTFHRTSDHPPPAESTAERTAPKPRASRLRFGILDGMHRPAVAVV